MSIQHTPWSIKSILSGMDVSVTLAESRAAVIVGIDGKHDSYEAMRRQAAMRLLKAGLPVQRIAGLQSVLVVPIG